MDSKQQQSKKFQQQSVGEHQQVGKENKPEDLGKGLGKDIKQQDKQGLAAGSDVNQRGRDLSHQQKASPGDDIPIKGSGRQNIKGAIGVGDKDALRMQEFPDAKQPQSLKNCGCCKRHFFADRIAKHEKACQLAHKKRSKFDIRAQRLAGLGISQKQLLASEGRVASKRAPRAWRQLHEDFLKQMRSSKKGRREQKFDAEPKVSARQQQRFSGKGVQQKDIKQQGLGESQQKGGLAGQGSSRSDEAHLGGQKGKAASDQPVRQTAGQAAR